jgi:hypothetical protein
MDNCRPIGRDNFRAKRYNFEQKGTFLNKKEQFCPKSDMAFYASVWLFILKPPLVVVVVVVVVVVEEEEQSHGPNEVFSRPRDHRVCAPKTLICVPSIENQLHYHLYFISTYIFRLLAR